jgi:hypothetical protein
MESKDNNKDNSRERLSLSLIAKDGAAMLETLTAGKLAVVRSKNDFMYVLLRGGTFHMFTHTPGSPEGGQKQFPQDEKYTAIVKNFATLADICVAVEFDEQSMNLYHVMSSAEEAILVEFPGDDRDADEAIDFMGGDLMMNDE